MDSISQHSLHSITLGQCLGQSVNRQLGDVVADGAYAGEMRHAARDVDNGLGAALGLQQQRQQSLDDGDLANIVDVHRLLEVLDSNASELVESRLMCADDGGIVDEQVQTAIRGRYRVGDELGRGQIGDVSAEDGDFEVGR